MRMALTRPDHVAGCVQCAHGREELCVVATRLQPDSALHLLSPGLPLPTTTSLQEPPLLRTIGGEGVASLDA